MLLTHFKKPVRSFDADMSTPLDLIKEEVRTIEIPNTQYMATPRDIRVRSILNNAYQSFKTTPSSELGYTQFQIPKATGGFRTINAPKEKLKAIQHQALKDFNHVPLLPHNATHAYVKRRGTKSAMYKHKNNKSKWFLKIDLKDFFPSCTREWLTSELINIHPFTIISHESLSLWLEPFLLDNALPQGAPTSPLLSNMAMTRIDHQLTKVLGRDFVYTRYADDLLISCRTHFDYQFVVGLVKSILPDNHKVNMRKVRYGSCNGRNWNLGLMYNQDMNVTVGHKQKHIIKSRVYNWIKSEAKDRDEYYKIYGILSYYRGIEPDYFNPLIDKMITQGFTL